MAIKGSSSTGAQDQDEKKDHPRRDGQQRGSTRDKDENRYEDPQAEQAEGRRTQHSQPGHSGQPSETGQQAKTDNTRPGGNRTKGGHHTQGRVDHS